MVSSTFPLPIVIQDASRRSANAGLCRAGQSMASERVHLERQTAAAAFPSSGSGGLVGRCFAHPVVDYLFVAGGLSIPIFIALAYFPGLTPRNGEITLRSFLLINGTHFAASTLRLYTKPGARRELPFLSWGFPVVCLAAVAAGLAWPAVGRNITALYFTWSPYHYAAQTYGLAVMYAMRSGARLDRHEKRQMWWVCLLPFVYAFMTSGQGGLAWFVSREWLIRTPPLSSAYHGVIAILTVLVFLLPVSLFWQLQRVRRRQVPAICLLLQVTNGMWWIASDYLDAWWWAAMFHSIQYLIVVVAHHVKEQMERPDRRGPLHRPIVYASGFYGVSLVLAAFLFFVVPLGYTVFGFGATQAFVVMTSMINLHHFVVDGFIWRTRRPGAAGLGGPSPVPLAI